jgi:hypothetical protein
MQLFEEFFTLPEDFSRMSTEQLQAAVSGLPASKRNFFEIAVSEGGLDVYYKILAQSQCDSMCTATLRLMFKYISAAQVFESIQRSFTFIPLSKVKSISDHFERFTFLYSVLKKRKFTPLLYSTLLNCVRISPEMATALRAQQLFNNLVIEVPDIIPLLLKLAKGSEIQETVLRDFYSVLSSDTKNLAILKQYPGWQGWVAVNGFASTTSTSLPSIELSPPPAIRDECNIDVVNIFSLFVIHCLHSSKEGHADINYMLSYVRALNPSYPSELVSVGKASSETLMEEPGPSELLMLTVLETVMTSLKMEAEYLLQKTRTNDRPSFLSDFSFLDLKNKNSPLLANMLQLFKTVEEVIFYPERGKWAPVSKKHQKLLSATIEVISLTGLMQPAGANSLRKSEVTADALKTLYIRFCAAWFYHMSPEDDTALSHHLKLCQKILGLSGPYVSPSAQLELESCFYMLHHLIQVAVRYNTRGKASELHNCKPLVTFMRELLAYYAPVTLSQMKQRRDFAPTYRLKVGEFYAHLTNSRKSTAEFFQILFDGPVLEVVVLLLKERVTPKLKAETSIAASVSAKWSKRIFAAVKEYHGIENRSREETQKKEAQLSGYDFRDEPLGPSKRRISNHYVKDLRAQQARLWRQLVRMHLLIFGNSVEDVEEGSDVTKLKIPVFRYKLDPYENRSRMRLKFKRNRKFQNHERPPLVPDSGGREDSTQGEELGHEAKLREANTKSMASTPEVWNPLEIDAGQMSDEDEGKGKEDTEKRKENKGERSLIKGGCTLITPTKDTNGTLELTTTHLYFVEAREDDPESERAKKKPRKKKTWPVSTLQEIHLRKFLQGPSAFEIFTKDGTNYFFNFPEYNLRNQFFNKINSLHGAALVYSAKSPPSENLQYVWGWEVKHGGGRGRRRRRGEKGPG